MSDVMQIVFEDYVINGQNGLRPGLFFSPKTQNLTKILVVICILYLFVYVWSV